MNWSRETLEERLKANPALKVSQPRIVKLGIPDGTGKRVSKAKPKQALSIPSFTENAPPEPRKKWGYEERLAQQLEDAGITGFYVDVEYLLGRRLRGDLVFPQKFLIVEIQGAVHRVKSQWKADILKAQDTMKNGWRLFPVGTDQVRDGSAVELVRAVLGREAMG